MAMEDFRVDVVVGKGPGATAIPLELNPFTLVGATTRAGLLTGPLRDRFGFVGQMEFYEPPSCSWCCPAPPGCSASSSPRRVRGDRRPVARHPRIANRLLRRVRDYAEVGPTAGSPARSPRPPSPSTTSTCSVWTGSTAPCSRPWSPLQRRACRRVHARRRRGRGAEHGRGGLRALPGAGRSPRPHPPRPGRHRGRLAAPRAGRCRRAGARSAALGRCARSASLAPPR